MLRDLLHQSREWKYGERIKKWFLLTLLTVLSLGSISLLTLALTMSLQRKDINPGKNNTLLRLLQNFHARSQQLTADALINDEKQDFSFDEICSVIKHYRRAVRLSPYVMTYRLRLYRLEAAVREQGIGCATHNQQELTELVEWTIKREPSRLATLRLAAEYFLETGNTVRSLELLRRSQELQEEGSPAQARFAIELVDTAEELKAALPATYPQIRPWLTHFAKSFHELPPTWRHIIAENLKKAISHLEDKRGARKMSFEQLLKAAQEIYPHALRVKSSKPRRMLDILLYKANKNLGERAAALYYKRKAKLTEIPVVLSVFRTHSFDDPLTAMVYQWKSPLVDQPVKVDTPNQNIGIFRSGKEDLGAIILESETRYSGLPFNRFRIFQSDDNRSFTEVLENFSISDYRVENRQHIMITFNAPTGRFIKILYPESQTHFNFSNSLYKLVKAYSFAEESLLND